MKIADMKIGVRLGLGFGLILLFLLAISAVGNFGMGRIDDSLNSIVKTSYTRIQLANDAARSVNAIVSSIQNMILSSDAAARREETRSIDQQRQLYKTAMDKLEKLEDSERGKELIAKAKQSLDNARR